MEPVDFSADQLRVDTPEQVELHFPVAGLGSRFIASLLDSLIQFVALLVLYLLLALTAVWTSVGHKFTGASDKAQMWMVAGLLLVNFGLYWGYYVVFETVWKGQTPGKRAMKLRVLKDSGRSVTLFESMARNLLRVMDYMPGLYLTGIITMLCNRRNKRLGDYVAGTIVVHERMDAQPVLSHAGGMMPGARNETPVGLPADAVARLGAADLHVIETFFARALDLPMDKREELGRRLVERLCGKMGVAVPVEVRAEKVLEEMVYLLRGGAR